MQKKIVFVDKDLKDIFPQYLKNRYNDMAMLSEAIKDDNFASIQSVGHKIAGNAGGYGLDELGELAHELEESAKEKNKMAVQEYVGRMQQYLQEIEVNFR